MSAEFELLPEHIALLRAMSWRWNDDLGIGAPEVDAKRPFGFSGRLTILADVHQIVHGARPADDLTDEQVDELEALYQGTFTALIIGLQAGRFTPGVYVHDGETWRPRDTIERPEDAAARYAVLYKQATDALAAARQRANALTNALDDALRAAHTTT